MSDLRPEFEEIEQIPWSALAAKTTDPWGRARYVVAAVLAVAVLGLLGGRLLSSGDEATVVTLPATEAPGPAPAITTTAVTSGPEAISHAEEIPPVAMVYSEADLMAISVEDESRLATMRAEWFVQDYFTVDGDERAAADLAELIGDQAIPHQDPAGYSYVEWARAFAMANPTPGRYAVDVAFRTLVPTATEGFARTDVRAVTVTIDVDVDGTTRLVDLPTPAPLPQTAPMEVPAGEPGIASDEMTAETLRFASGTGLDPLVTAVTRDGDLWRFVVQMGDPSGNRWPMVVPGIGP